MYEISLVKNKNNGSILADTEYFMTYKWFEIPVVGDYIHISENEVFVVKGRLLPSDEVSDRVVLLGETVFLFRSAECLLKL